MLQPSIVGRLSSDLHIGRSHGGELTLGFPGWWVARRQSRRATHQEKYAGAVGPRTPALIFILPLDPGSRRAILQVHRKIETNVQVVYSSNDALQWQAGG